MRLVAQPSEEADDVFADEPCPGAMWFTAGNHEDYELLKELERGAGRGADSFAVDAYGKLRCIRDGRVAELPGGLRVGALWGIDDRAPRAASGFRRAAGSAAAARRRCAAPASTCC